MRGLRCIKYIGESYPLQRGPRKHTHKGRSARTHPQGAVLAIGSLLVIRLKGRARSAARQPSPPTGLCSGSWDGSERQDISNLHPHLDQWFEVRARDTITKMDVGTSTPPSLTLLSMVRADYRDTPIRGGPMVTSPLYPASAMWRHTLRRSQLQTKRQGVSPQH